MDNFIIDAKDQVLGRLSSSVAKKLLNGERIIIINSKKTIVSGKPNIIMKDFVTKRERGDPFHGPFYPKTPNGILRRSIRGMIPYKKTKGREALKRLKIYEDNPKKLEGKKIQKTRKDLDCKYMTLEEISKKLKGK